MSSSLLEALKLIGSLLGLVAFVWNIWTAFRSYLALGLEIRLPEGRDAIIRVSVSNSGVTRKTITYAVLLVAAERLTLSDAISAFERQRSPSPNRPVPQKPLLRLFHLAANEDRFNRKCALFPLRELYGEQAMVGPGESVSYACSVDLSRLESNCTYLVRFIVFVSYLDIFLRWRFTADAFHNSPAKSDAH